MRRLAAVAILGALTVMAALPTGRVYRGELLGWLLTGAALGSVLLSAALRRRPAWIVAPASVAALLAYSAVAVAASAASADVPGSLPALWLDAAGNGLPRMLTALVPVEPQPDTVLVPVAAAWLSGMTTAEIGLRARLLLTSYLPPAALYAGGLVLVGPQRRPELWYAVLLAAVALVGLAVAEPRDLRRPPAARPRSARPLATRLRLAAGAIAAGGACLALVAAAGPALANLTVARPVDVRRQPVPPPLDTLDENPLARISGWALDPGAHLFDVDTRGGGVAPPGGGDGGDSGHGPDGGDSADTADSGDGGDSAHGADSGQSGAVLRIRLAVLTEFDGVTWQVGGRYRPAGQALPPIADGAAPGDRAGQLVTQHITIADLTGHLLPAAAEPRSVRGVRVDMDPDSGGLVTSAGLRSGLAYTVVSRRPVPDRDALATAEVPSGASAARLLALGTGTPDDLVDLAHRVTEGQSLPYQRAVALEGFLSAHYTLVGDAPSGHAYPNLRFFLLADRASGGQRGTCEQFATAFAVLARMLGLPTRVVVGFRVHGGHSAVHGADALAWPEVLFRGVGWVAFDPLPRAGTRPQPVEQEVRPSPPPAGPPPTAAVPLPSAVPSSSRVAAGQVGAARQGSGVSGWSLAVAVPALLASGYPVAVILLRRRLRRRRLDTGPPADRVLGAWREVLDALRLAGHRVPATLTAMEVAAFAAEVGAGAGRTRLPVPPIDALAAAVNEVSYAPARAAGTAATGTTWATTTSAVGVTTTSAARTTTGAARTTTSGAARATVPDRAEATTVAAGMAGMAGTARTVALAYAAEVRARRSWWRRVAWSLDPRPLRRYRRG